MKEALQKMSVSEGNQSNILNKNKVIEAAIGKFYERFDSDKGGFGEAPKFPTPVNLSFLHYCIKSSVDSSLKEICKQMSSVTLDVTFIF